ncbi:MULTISPECIES: Fe-S cluster assembly protein SufD [Flavobacteriaceae]|uniref:Fe-S cluster assembly protein SufD n=2 Tax=Flavobacteriaceae TaxID=49546 RepID=A0A4Y8ASN0_9FLAO|nr:MULTISPECIES: Fe-S cluster assembly protein SufD [Flavobacteriaceae]TEW73678.1 Fe-S cluster assembly protein SufD [Gramella jeungdoensis]GGK36625.1 Fe-S cluster assembly protein SufD [Lutibacter litoralis]
MDLKEKLVSSFLAFENKGGLDLDSNVHSIRSKAILNFEKEGFPTKKDEEWKYTSLNSLLKNDYSLFPKTKKAVEFKNVKEYSINEIESYTLVFIDGVFSSFLSDTTHDDCDVCVLSSALTRPKYKMVVDNYFNTIAKNNNSLTELNTAFSVEGAFINIPKNTIVPKPIQILNFSTGSEKEVMLQPRNLVVVGENSHVQIIERHQNLSKNAVLTNAVTEIFVHKRAIVDYYKIQNDTENSSLIDSTFVSQKQQSVASVHTYSFGGKLTRNNLEFYQEGEHINSHLNGISILNKKQHVDNHTLVNHKYPNCESHELYKGIYADKSTGVFNGKVIVQQAAQKTNAFQQNNNILIDDGASINSKPQLEIFADDVKCSHGCTIGQLDESALFYMQSRGIPKKEAKALLLFAFGNDVVEKIKIPQLKTRITKLIAKNLGVNLGFEF